VPFVDLCAGLWNNDHPVFTVVESYRTLRRLLAEPDQVRTGSDFEARCFAALEALRPALDDVRSWDEAEVGAASLLRIPPLTILGEVSPDWAFDLVCWNGANGLAEGVRRPYGAAVAIANEGFHRPADAFELVAPMTELMIRYEDVPEAREATGGEIRRVLEDFRARAPWPVTTAEARATALCGARRLTPAVAAGSRRVVTVQAGSHHADAIAKAFSDLGGCVSPVSAARAAATS
jgi:hypothetical protein